MKAGAIFYTHNTLDGTKLFQSVQDSISKSNILVVSVSNKPINFGTNFVDNYGTGFINMFHKIVFALERSEADYIFFLEHDVKYHPSHFDFTPEDPETFYYNQNVWLLRPDGHALHFDVNQLSGLCVYREAALIHWREHLEKALFARPKMDDHHFNKFIRHMGFEPFTHGRINWDTKYKMGTWKSEYPNVDIKHGGNATGQRWEKKQYRNQKLLINWQESENWSILGWEKKDLVFE